MLQSLQVNRSIERLAVSRIDPGPLLRQMHAPSIDRSQFASAAAFVAGALVWALAPLFTEKGKEPWDSGIYYYAAAVFSCFAISLATFKWKEVIGGWYFGQVLCLAGFGKYIFGSGVNLMMVFLALAMCLPLPLGGSLAGCAVRWLVTKVVERYRDES